MCSSLPHPKENRKEGERLLGDYRGEGEVGDTISYAYFIRVGQPPPYTPL